MNLGQGLGEMLGLWCVCVVCGVFGSLAGLARNQSLRCMCLEQARASCVITPRRFVVVVRLVMQEKERMILSCLIARASANK